MFLFLSRLEKIIYRKLKKVINSTLEKSLLMNQVSKTNVLSSC